MVGSLPQLNNGSVIEFNQESDPNHLSNLLDDFSAKNLLRNGYILDRLQHNAAKMVAQAIRKGATKYQPQVGDEVLVLRDLDQPAKIVAISHNNRYKLRFLDDSPLPHDRTYFLSTSTNNLDGIDSK